MKEIGWLVFGIYVLLTLWLLANAIVQVHLWRLSRKKVKKSNISRSGVLPFVSLQVPVYNERYVVEGLLESLALLDYPKDRFEVLVLDDSTDDTKQLVDQKAALLKLQGVNFAVIRRENRHGYKAGALQESLANCRGEFIAVFDADFRPRPSFLLEMITHFHDPFVGLVQARWSHLNLQQNFLTRIQSYLLDTYFSIEQQGRFQGGYFSNFCGTAGIWRKACIIEAGGWDGKVLSEDLDLSYRAQLKGWKIVYNHETDVPAELPSTMEAFKIQQARWTKGIMQVLLKNGKTVARSPHSIQTKMHAFFHLSGSFVFPCLLVNSILSLPLLLLRQTDPTFISLTNYAAIGGLNLVLLTFIFYKGTRQNSDESFWKFYPLFLLVYMGLSVQNTVGVVEAWLGRRSAFIRTPKYANQTGNDAAYRPKKQAAQAFELGFFFYFLTGIAVSFYVGDYFFLLLFLMMATGVGLILVNTLRLRRPRWTYVLQGPGLQESMLTGDGQ